MTNPDYTHIFALVDVSGSMYDIAADAEGSLRTLLAEQFEQPGLLTVTVGEFSNGYRKVAERAPADTALEGWHLQPNGGTALLDAIGKIVTEEGQVLAGIPEAERPGKVIGLIVTDGHENQSTEWTRESVNKLIKEQEEKYGWEFIFLAAGQDAIAEGARMGLRNAGNYTNTGTGVKSAYMAASASMTQYRGGRTRGVEVPENIPEDATS